MDISPPAFGPIIMSKVNPPWYFFCTILGWALQVYFLLALCLSLCIREGREVGGLEELGIGTKLILLRKIPDFESKTKLYSLKIR